MLQLWFEPAPTVPTRVVTGVTTSNAPLPAPVRPDEYAPRVYPLPVLSMIKFANTATPLVALTVGVPDSLPALGLVAIAIAMLLVAEGTVFPKPSVTVTCTAGAIAPPATTLVGCTANASRDAGATVT